MGGEGAAPGPVSYTHLDVYKRQELDRVLKITEGVMRSMIICKDE